MTPMERILAIVPDFPGYQGVADRRKSDEVVRANVGERLASLPEDHHAAQLERLLARCEFANAQAFSHFEDDPNPQRIAAILDADADLLEGAKSLESGTPADLDRVLTHFEGTLDRRDSAMLAVH